MTALPTSVVATPLAVSAAATVAVDPLALADLHPFVGPGPAADVPLVLDGLLPLDGLAQVAREFMRQYGYLAVFAFTFLETSLLFPLLPSEVVLPFAASLLVSDPVSFVLFVVASTAGVTVGSVVAYHIFGRGGEEVVERFGPLLRVSDREIRWSKRWFRRWGESAVLWGRLLPVLRSAISIPAGFASMDRRRFTAYSAIGGLLFNSLVGAAALYGEEGVYQFLAGRVSGFATSSPLPVAVGAAVLLVAVGAAALVARRSDRW